tara:strand:- start:2115 stop:3053 length:939 start_codon:yes stop_codon:yes gene_type:complete
MQKKILLLGSLGMVGSSIGKLLKESEGQYNLIESSRRDTDLFSYDETKDLITETQPDVAIIAAAKVGGIVFNNTKRSDFILENLKINMNILESCIPFPNIKVINLGSSCIYPLDAPNPISEKEFMNGQLEETNSPYAMAKISAIEIGRAISTEFGHKVINLMPTNLYGPNDFFHPVNGHVIPSLIARMHDAKLNKETEFNIWGTGTPLREFLFVDDLAECVKFIIDKNIDNDLINVGSSVEISIANLAVLIKDSVGFEGELIFDTSKPDGNPRKLLDSSLINGLGWESKTTLERGLKYTYDWYVKNKEIARH